MCSNDVSQKKVLFCQTCPQNGLVLSEISFVIEWWPLVIFTLTFICPEGMSSEDIVQESTKCWNMESSVQVHIHVWIVLVLNISS